jgi:integrase
MVDRVSPKSPEAAVKTGAKAAARLPRRRPVPRHPGIYYRPRPSGKIGPPYEFCYLDSAGIRRWEIVHGNLDVAETRRAELRIRRTRGERIQPTRQTFADYAAEWLDRQTVRPRTLELYTWALSQHLVPYFGRWRLDHISVDDVAAYIAHMRKKKLKGWTISSSLRPLSMILGQAARKGHIPVNPMTQLERGERPKHDDQRPKRILTLDEMQALLAATETLQTRCLFELMLSTGVRVGEALGLTAGDLDLDGAIVRIECQLDRNGTRSLLKTAESRRAIDIPPRLMRKLRALLLQRGVLGAPDALVFVSRNGTGLERKVVRGALARAVKDSKIAAPAPTLHDLRHSHASMLIALDYSIVDVQRRLGHRKPDTTLRVYSHQWHYRDTQRSSIGDHLGRLFTDAHKKHLATGRRRPLALPAATASARG